eukprot:gene4623-5774_t
MKILILFVIVLFYSNQVLASKKSSLSTDESIVETLNGPIKGNILPNYRSFLGVPFAQPPVGNLRWENPIPSKVWSNTLDCREFAPACPQTCTLPPGACPESIEEDCLYLNVFTPRKNSTEIQPLKPVMVYIPGGRFESGTASVPMYEPEYFVKSANIVVVTVNYRLGFLGFLGSDETNGNFGFLDQVVALQWVRNNIHAFGGDRNKITIVGESAGAASVVAHLVSPLSLNLFRAAVLQSTPITLGFKTKDAAKFYAERFAKEVKCNITDLHCFRQLDIPTILDAQSKAGKFDQNYPIDSFCPWSPVIDGNIIPGQMSNLMSEGNFHDVPIIIGENTDEGEIFIYKAFKTFLINAVYVYFTNILYKSDSAEVRKIYPGPVLKDNRPVLSELSDDYMFECPTNYIAKQVSMMRRSPIYLYNFNHQLSYNAFGPRFPECIGKVCHGAELAVLFNNEERLGFVPTPEEKQLGIEMNNYWSNFIVNLDPNIGLDIPQVWPKLNYTNPQVLYFETPTRVGPLRSNEGCDLFDELGYGPSHITADDLVNTNTYVPPVTYTVIVVLTINLSYGRLDLGDATSQITFNNQSVCTNSDPCDWFDSSIWIGGQVPGENNTALLQYNGSGSQPQFYIYANQTINVSTLSLQGGFSLNISAGSNTLNVTMALVVKNSQLLIMAPSTIGSLYTINSTVAIQSTSANITGELLTDQFSIFIFNDTDIVTFYGDNTQFLAPVNAYQGNNIQFLGSSVSFQGFYGTAETSIKANYLENYNAALVAGNLNILEGASFSYSASIIYQGIQTGPGGYVKFNSASLVIQGNYPSYISLIASSLSGAITFVNATQLQIDSVQSVASGGQYLGLYIDNCGNVTIGNNDQPFANLYDSLYVSGVSSVSLLGIHSISSGFFYQPSLSGSTLPSNIEITIFNHTNIYSSCSQTNTTITVAPNAQILFKGGYNINQQGGIIVNQNGSLFFTNPFVVGSYILGSSGLTLQEGSTFNSILSNITGDINVIGKDTVVNSYLTSVNGNIYLSGGPTLNINVTTFSFDPSFKSKSIQQISGEDNSTQAIINIIFTPSFLFFFKPNAIQTTNANISNTVINVYLDSSQTSFYKGETFTIWNSQTQINGNYQKRILDSNKNAQEFNALSYTVSDNGYLITIKIGSTQLAPWKIGVIVACSRQNTLSVSRMSASQFQTLGIKFSIFSPAIDEDNIITEFKWKEGKEDSKDNMTLVMSKLKDLVTLPEDVWFMNVTGKQSLFIEDISELTLKGGTDVLIVSSKIKEIDPPPVLTSNTQVQIELKKEDNIKTSSYEQFFAEHLILERLSRFPVLSILTDMITNWRICWTDFGKPGNISYCDLSLSLVIKAILCTVTKNIDTMTSPNSEVQYNMTEVLRENGVICGFNKRDSEEKSKDINSEEDDDEDDEDSDSSFKSQPNKKQKLLPLTTKKSPGKKPPGKKPTEKKSTGRKTSGNSPVYNDIANLDDVSDYMNLEDYSLLRKQMLYKMFQLYKRYLDHTDDNLNDSPVN